MGCSDMGCSQTTGGEMTKRQLCKDCVHIGFFSYGASRCAVYVKVNHVSGYERLARCEEIRGDNPTCEKFEKKKKKGKKA